MGWFSQTLALFKARFATLVLTAGLALLPANLIASGAMRFATAASSAESTEPPSDKAADRTTTDRLQLRGPAPEKKNPPADLTAIFSVALATALSLTVLFLGIALAHAALVPVVLGKARGPADAWAVAGSRMGALIATGIPGALVIAAGLVLLVVPGLLAMINFGFAVPVVLAEGLHGRKALDRSCGLMRSRRLAVASMWLLIVLITGFSFAAAHQMPPGAWRLAAGTLLRVVAYPLPLAGLIILYREARRAETASVHPPDLSAGIVVR